MQILVILWLRQMRRYVRSRSRVIGGLGQPLLFLLALGYGLGAVYKRAGAGDYLQFLVPGIIIQTILFTSVFWGSIILFDRRFGFLSELLVAPVSRLRILAGSATGGATISFIQATMLLAIALLMGFSPVSWVVLPTALALMAIISLALTFLGAGIASMVEDFQGFQAINNFVIFPLFFLSSALYPLTGAPPVLKLLGSLNPISYMVDALRHVLIGHGHFAFGVDLLVITASLVGAMLFAVNRFNRIQM